MQTEYQNRGSFAHMTVLLRVSVHQLSRLLDVAIGYSAVR